MRPLTRRKLLRAAGAGAGAALLAPFYREALADAPVPRRLVIVLECNSFYARTMFTPAALTAVSATNIDQPFFGRQSPMTTKVLTGEHLAQALSLDSLAATPGNISLENRAAVILGLSSVVTGGGHSTGTGALSSSTDGAAATIDAVLAPKIKRAAPYDAIRLGTSTAPNPIVYGTCNYAPHKPAPILVNPTLAFQSLFGSIASGQSAGPDRAALFGFEYKTVQKALNTFRGGSNERAKLERYLESLDTLRGRENTLMQMAAAVRPLLPLEPASNPVLVPPGAGLINHMAYLEAMFQMATTSLLGGLTNTVVLASGTSGFAITYDPAVTPLDRHSLQHGIGVPANWQAIHTITGQHVKLIADLARTLAKTPEVNANGSMLDNTAILFISDNGEQHHSVAQEWPALLVGGNALGLKTDGRTVIYPSYAKTGNRQVSNLFNTLGHAMGDSSFDTFGNEGGSRIAAGPLSELI